MKCIISIGLWKQSRGLSLPCVSFLTIPANRGRNKRTGSSWWRWLLHTDYQAETSLRFYWNNASLAFTESSPVFILRTLPSARNSVLWSRWSRFYHRSNLALCFLHWLLTALYLDLGWTFQNSVLPQIFQISKSHSIILYPRFFLNLKSLKPNRLRILEWFPFDKFSASVYKTGWPLVKQFSNPQCTPWLFLSRRKKKILLQQASLVVSLVAQKVKSACDVGDPGSILGSGRPPGKMNGNPLQYSCLENSMDRGAWRAPWCHKELDMAEGLTFSLSNELWLQQFCDWVLCGF